MLDDDFAAWLNDHNKGLIENDWSSGWCTSSAVNIAMEDWLAENCR